MTILYPSDNLKILDYNRVLKSLNDMTPEEFRTKLSEFYELSELPDDSPRKPQEVGFSHLFIEGKWWQCKIKDEYVDNSDPVGCLDTAMLSEYCLNRILGIENVRTDKRIDFVGGIRGTEELEKRCSEDCVAAFAMYPCKMDQIFAVADAGKIMPPKCTWYEPKPRSGFVVNVFKE